jgi:hypothetical protein
VEIGSWLFLWSVAEPILTLGNTIFFPGSKNDVKLLQSGDTYNPDGAYKKKKKKILKS